jgi:hypothetical protein
MQEYVAEAQAQRTEAAEKLAVVDAKISQVQTLAGTKCSN